MIINDARVLQWCSTKESNNHGVSDKEHVGTFPGRVTTFLMKAAFVFLVFLKREKKFPSIPLYKFY